MNLKYVFSLSMCALVSYFVYLLYVNKIITSNYESDNLIPSIAFSLLFFIFTSGHILQIINKNYRNPALIIVSSLIIYYVFFSGRPGGYTQLLYLWISFGVPGGISGAVTAYTRESRAEKCEAGKSASLSSPSRKSAQRSYERTSAFPPEMGAQIHSDTGGMQNEQISKDDPLAPWRPGAPWPREEKEIWGLILQESDHDPLQALKALELKAVEFGERSSKQSKIIYSLLLRLFISQNGEEHHTARTSIDELAHCYRNLGEPKLALPLLEKLLEISQKVLGEDHPDTLTSLNNLASCRSKLGDERRALTLHEQALEHRRVVLGEDHHDTLNSLNNLASCYVKLGDARRALPLCEKALERSRAILGEDHTATLVTLNNLAFCYRKVGELRRAQSLHEEALARHREALGEDHPNTLCVLSNLSQSCIELGDITQGIEYMMQALKLRMTVLGEEHPDTLRSIHELATVLMAAGDARWALQLYGKVLGRRKAVQGEDHPDYLNSLIGLATCQIRLELFDAARVRANDLFVRLGQGAAQNGNWHGLAASASQLCLDLRFSEHPIPWRSTCRSISRAFLADLDLTEPSDVEHILGPFREFHGNWLKLCLADGAADEIPHVLSAVQGREMAAMLLAELEASEADYPAGDPRKLYLEVVRELRQLRLMLRSAEKREEQGAGFDGGFDDGSRRFQVDAETALRLAEQRRANTDLLRERYTTLLEQMKDLRGQIAELDKTFALAYKPPDVSVERLAEGMAADEAKVLLFMHAQEDGAELVPHACCITADGKADVLVLEAMPAAHEAMNTAGLRGTARMGMRGGRGAAPLTKWDIEEASGGEDTGSDEPLADLAALVGEALWQPLRAKYPQVTNWHLATHQNLHVLPVGLGLDPAHTMTVHPGLLFLARKQDEAVYDIAPSRLAMHSDPAVGTSNPIPFVEAEVALARLIWGDNRIALSDGEETLVRLNEADPPLDALLLAAHGDELDSEPPQTIVWLDRAEERMLDTTAVLSSSQRPGVVIASACVAGRIREDSLGEPLGLVSALFLHGARFVLAPLQPIPDLQAPLVMGLFHRAWRETGDPRQAWQMARDQALTGQWPEGYEEQLTAAYGDVMRAMLERAVTDDDYIYSVILRSGWNIEPADRAGLMVFEDDDQVAVERRGVLMDKLVTEGVSQILTERVKAAQGKPSSAIRRICDWTMPFGS